MNIRNILLALLIIIGFSGLAGTQASAQASRTWVSGVGDDANPCSRTAPCKTFAGAISKTAAAGTINCLDPGGFGAVTITKSMTIDCTGQSGGILSSLTSGIIVNGANIIVKVRHLAIEGFNNGINGVRVLNAAAVHLDDVAITQIGGTNGAGIRVDQAAGSVELVVTNSSIDDSGVAPNVGGGVLIQPGSGVNVRFVLDNVTLANNTNGLNVIGQASGTIRGSITNSKIVGNGNAGILATGVGARIMVDNSSVTGNNFGIFTVGSANVVVSNSQITGNTTGLSANAPGTIQSYASSHLLDNTTNGSFTAPSVPEN